MTSSAPSVWWKETPQKELSSWKNFRQYVAGFKMSPFINFLVDYVFKAGWANVIEYIF